MSTPQSHTPGRTIGVIVILATQDAGSGVVVAEARDVEKSTTTFVAKVRSAPVAGHVVAARRALDEYAARGTFLTVGDSVSPALGPMLEKFVTAHEVLARRVAVPRRVTLEAPFDAAFLAHDLYVFFAEVFQTKERIPPREGMLGDMRAVGTRLAASIALRVHHQPIKALLLLGVQMKDNFGAWNILAALRIRTRHLDYSLFQTRLNRGAETRRTHYASAAGQLQLARSGFETNYAFTRDSLILAFRVVVEALD